MQITVAIISANRPSVLHETVLELFNQFHPPDEILIVHPETSSAMAEEHVSLETRKLPVRVISSPRGCSQQRNAAIDSTVSDVLLFLDDDAQLDVHYLEECLRILRENTDAVGVSGWVVVDGAMEPHEIKRDNAKRILQEIRSQNASLIEGKTFHGCNMVVRTSIAKLVRFDENLQAYSIFDDRDFGNRVKHYGRIIYALDCRLVHLATRSGRVSAVSFGIAQVRTPLYCWRKGSFSGKETLQLICNCVGGNLMGLVKPSRGKNRQIRARQLVGNLKGAMLSVREFVRGSAKLEERPDSESAAREHSSLRPFASNQEATHQDTAPKP